MTLKVRLLLAMALIAGFLIAAAWTVTRTTTTYLVDQVDEQLVRFASGPAGGGPRVPPPVGGGPTAPGPTAPNQTDSGPIVADGPASSGSDPVSSDPGSYSTVYVGAFVDGVLQTRVAPRRGSSHAAVPAISATGAKALAEGRSIATVESSDAGVRYRVSSRVDPDEGLVVVGVPLDDVDATVSRLVVVELVATGVVLAVLGLITWWVLRLGVRPVKRMTTAAATIAAADLSHRVPAEAPGTEAHDLGVALNTMLERIESAFAERAASEERLRRFVADASHELRTPVTTVRGYAELYRLGGLGDAERLDAAMARTEAEAQRMGGLVEDLLTLARLDRGIEADPVPVALHDVVADAVEDLRVRHPDHPVTVDIGPTVVLGDLDRLHQVAANLLTNAAVHTPPGTGIDVMVGSSGDRARLTVRDHGLGLGEHGGTRAFERFWRADPSRSRASGGSGLGLSIVAAIVASMDGSVRLEQPMEGTGVEAVVELPARMPLGGAEPRGGAAEPVRR